MNLRGYFSSVLSTQSSVLPPSERLGSLDAFRGFDMLAMLLVGSVSDPAQFPAQFLHRGWNDGRHGATFCDLIFPWFLFIVGVAIPLSMAAGRGRGLSTAARLLQAARRGFVLYSLGCLIHAARTSQVSLLTWDILQHIGVAYFVAAVLYHCPRAARVTFVVLVLVGKWVLLRHIPYPGVDEVLWTREQNVQRWLTTEHLGWFGGLLNVLPGASLVVIATFVGDWLRRPDRSPAGKTGGLLLAGFTLTSASWLWQFDLPYSKDFFTSSYVLLSAGTGCALLAGFYWVCDARRWTRLMVFVIPGRNAIGLYVAAGVLSAIVLHRWTVPVGGEVRTLVDAVIFVLTDWLGGFAGAWTFSTVYLVCWWLFTYWLYRKHVFLKV